MSVGYPLIQEGNYRVSGGTWNHALGLQGGQVGLEKHSIPIKSPLNKSCSFLDEHKKVQRVNWPNVFYELSSLHNFILLNKSHFKM